MRPSPLPALLPPQQLWQLGDVRSDAPRFVTRHQSRCRSPAGLLLEIDLGQRQAGVILHDEAGIRFLRELCSCLTEPQSVKANVAINAVRKTV
jgi:hypothetical protein